MKHLAFHAMVVIAALLHSCRLDEESAPYLNHTTCSLESDRSETEHIIFSDQGTIDVLVVPVKIWFPENFSQLSQ